MTVRPSHAIALSLLCFALEACSGSSADPVIAASSSSVSSSTSSASTSSSSSSASSSISSTSSSSAASSSSSAASSSSATPAARLVTRLGRSLRLQIGLGGNNETIDMISQNLHPDIYDRYLVGVGAGSWPSWNSPSGAYVGVVANAAESVNAIPMFTLYQMASNGDSNLTGLDSSTFMTAYWANVQLMFEQIAVYGKPALVNLEPDFWGYVQRQAPGADPAARTALVSLNTDCATLANNVTGVARCLLVMARKYAPKAYVGFPPSDWGGDTTASVVTFMNVLGANDADFIVMQTSDRDAGCYEAVPHPAYCPSLSATPYWDESNISHPDFTDHLATARAYHVGIGNLPLLWWQTPMGRPSLVAGGTDYHYRDNRVNYFLTHSGELVAAGGFGVVFGGGELHQTNITTDGGQFQSLSTSYLANPAPLN